MGNKAVIHLYIPFKTHNYISFRMNLLKDKSFVEEQLFTGFYLRYIDRIFNNDGIFGDCMVVKSNADYGSYSVGNVQFGISNARIFSFDTSVSFLEMSIPFECESIDGIANITSMLRLSNHKRITDNSGDTVSINDIALGIIEKYGRITIFDHISSFGETRPELLVSVIMDEKTDDVDMHAYRIASGLDNRCNEIPSDVKFYSNFSYIRWAVTSRGVCNIGIKTDNEDNNKFISNRWFTHTDTRYVVWYILVLHQKYSLYQYMNDIASKSTKGSLREFQKKIMVFNTKYRFSLISEEVSYQKLYEIMSDVKGLEAEFNDIDEEIVRISEYIESKSDKNSARAMMIISILCAVSAVKDFYDIINEGNIVDNLMNLGFAARFMFVVLLLLIAVALLIVVPKKPIKKVYRYIKKYILKLKSRL